MRKITQKIAIFLAVLLVVTGLPVTRSHASEIKYRWVRSSKELKTATEDKNTKKIIIKSWDKDVLRLNAKDGLDVSSKILQIEAENVKIKNYLTFESVKVKGSSNTYCENAGNSPVVVMGDRTKVLVKTKEKVPSITVKADNTDIQIKKDASVKRLKFTQSGVKATLTAYGELEKIDLIAKTDLRISGQSEDTSVICNGEGSVIRTNIPLDCTFKKDAQINLGKKAGGSQIKTVGETDVTITNNTGQDLPVLTEHGTVVIKDGTTSDTSYKEETENKEDQNENNQTDPPVVTNPVVTNPVVNPAPGAGAGTGSGGSSSSNPVFVNTLTSIQLDTEQSSLVSTSGQSQPVKLLTYNQNNAAYSYDYSSTKPQVSLSQAVISQAGLTLTNEGVSQNPGRYYRIDGNAITFLSADQLDGVYTWEIGLDGLTKQCTITITGGTVVPSKTIMLPYTGTDSANICSNSTVDLAVKSDADLADSKKTVQYALYEQTGDCTPVLKQEITLNWLQEHTNSFYFRVYGPFGELVLNSRDTTVKTLAVDLVTTKTIQSSPAEPVSQSEYNAVEGDVVKKKETGTYTAFLDLAHGDNKETYSSKLTATDTQGEAVLTQVADQVAFTDPGKEVLRNTYNQKNKDDFRGGITRYDELSKDTKANLKNTWNISNGVKKCCNLTYQGKTYPLTSLPVYFKNNYVDGSENQYSGSTLSYSKITALTPYIDVNAIGNHAGSSPLYVPLSLKNLNIGISFKSILTENELTVDYAVSNKAVNFNSEEPRKHWVGLNEENSSLYVKLKNSNGSDITNYASYALMSDNPSILELNGNMFDENTHSVKITPHMKGTAVISIYRSSDRAVVGTMTIEVKDYHSDSYSLSLDKDEITVSKSTTTPENPASVRLILMQGDTPDSDYLFQAGDLGLSITNAKTVSGEAITDDIVGQISEAMNNEMLDSLREGGNRNLSNVYLVCWTDDTIQSRGDNADGIQLLPNGIYEFTFTVLGHAQTITVNITD